MANPLRRAPPPPPMRKGAVQAFEALYSYKAKKPNELSFEDGDLLYILDQKDPNWWLARQDNKEGLIPSNYVSNENVLMPIIDAARRGNLTLLNECLLNGISVNSLDKTGSSALHAACMSGHLECVQRLLQEQNIELNLQNKIGDTPLHNAASKGHDAICEMLLSRGANKGITNIENKTPRSLARSSLVIGMFDDAILPKVSRVTSYQGNAYIDEDEDDSDEDN